MPVLAGHRAPRHSHNRSLPQGRPDTPTADASPGGPQILPQQTPAPHPGKSLHGQDFRSPQETLRAPYCRPTSQWVNDQPLLSGAQWHICAL